MNKKIISALIFILTLALALNCPILTTLADNSGAVPEIKSIYDSDEIGEILKAIENNADTEVSEKADPFKLYSLSPSDFSEINTEYVLKITESGDYKWIVPSDNRIITVGQKQNKWDVLGYSESGTESGEYKLGAFVKEILSQADTDVLNKSCICFEIPEYHTYFFGVFSENDGYVIPYGSRPDLTGLENGKRYSPANADKILTDSFGTVESDNVDTNGGGTGDKAENNNFWIILSAFAVILLLSVSIFLFGIKKSRK